MLVGTRGGGGGENKLYKGSHLAEKRVNEGDLVAHVLTRLKGCRWTPARIKILCHLRVQQGEQRWGNF